jgi:hypothetical protein
MIEDDGFCARKRARKMSDFCFWPFSRKEISRIWRDEILTMEIQDGETFQKSGIWHMYEHLQKAQKMSYLKVWPS